MKKLFTNLIALLALALIPTAKANAFKVYVTGDFSKNICAYIYDNDHQKENAYNGAWDASLLNESNVKAINGTTFRYVEVNSESEVNIILHYKGQDGSGNQTADIKASNDIYLSYAGGASYTDLTSIYAPKYSIVDKTGNTIGSFNNSGKLNSFYVTASTELYIKAEDQGSTYYIEPSSNSNVNHSINESRPNLTEDAGRYYTLVPNYTYNITVSKTDDSVNPYDVNFDVNIDEYQLKAYLADKSSATAFDYSDYSDGVFTFYYKFSDLAQNSNKNIYFYLYDKTLDKNLSTASATTINANTDYNLAQNSTNSLTINNISDYYNKGYITIKYTPNNAESGILSYSVNIENNDDNEWVLEVSGDGKNWEHHALTASRVRNSGPKSDNLYTLGLKAEQLPMGNDRKTYWYIHGKNNTNVTFRPSTGNGTWTNGLEGVTLYNSNLKSYQTIANTKKVGAFTANTNNTFVINTGEDMDNDKVVSYTFAINTSEISYNRSANNDGGQQTWTRSVPANSVALYKNASITSIYSAMFPESGSGSFNPSVKFKGNVEPYYLIGCLDGTAYKSNTDHPMTRTIYYNPQDKNVVDSVVYNITVEKNGSDFNKLYLGFMPQSLWNNVETDNITFKTNGSEVGTNRSAWNFIIRPEVQDTYDALASHGSLIICGTNSLGFQNSNQALNPIVDETYNYQYYIVHLNVTTSTYEIEFIQNAPELKVGYMRTFSSKVPLNIPSTLKAYAVQKVDFSAGGMTTDIKGTIHLYQLQHIPADQGVVLVYEDNAKGSVEESAKVIPTAIEGVSIRTRDILTGENLWANPTKHSGETYANLLAPVLTNDENGILVGEGTKNAENEYVTRHFVLNHYYATDNADKNQADYFGFFRFKKNHRIKNSYAYLSIPRSILENNAQYAGTIFDDEISTSAKMALVFDDDTTTGINSISCEENAKKENAWYNLQGMRVNKPTKGLYIYNGRKVIIK